jgi:hypothetical protein
VPSISTLSLERLAETQSTHFVAGRPSLEKAASLPLQGKRANPFPLEVEVEDFLHQHCNFNVDGGQKLSTLLALGSDLPALQHLTPTK